MRWPFGAHENPRVRPDGRRRRATPRAPAPAPRAAAGALDGGVVTACAALAALGIVMVYSATAPLAIGEPIPPQALRHLGSLAAGALLIAIVLHVPLGFWRAAALPLWIACVTLLVATLLLGVKVNGAQRWLAIPGAPIHLQAGELAKLATALAVATVLARVGPRGLRRLHPLVLSLLLGAVPALLLLAQPDFGSAAVLLALTGLLLFAAGTPLRWLAGLAGLGLVATGLYVAMRPYAAARWRGFLDPWQSAQAEGFQLVQSFVAFGRGGSTGVGLGDGRQKLFYLPEAHTDFILSVVAEELGLVGVLAVLGAFAALVVAGARIARRARDPFALLVAFGMTCFLAVPAAVNAGVVMGVLPTTGFTLPFVSYGSNSLLVCALATGLLLRIGAREAPLAERRVAGAERRGRVRHG